MAMSLCGWVISTFLPTQSQLFCDLKCWYSWACSDSFENKNVFDRILQYPTDLQAKPAGNSHFCDVASRFSQLCFQAVRVVSSLASPFSSCCFQVLQTVSCSFRFCESQLLHFPGTIFFFAWQQLGRIRIPDIFRFCSCLWHHPVFCAL